MNFLNFFFITSNLFLIGIWIANFIGIINNGITQDSKYFTVNIFLVIPIWLFIWFKLAQKQNKETEKNLENYKQKELNSENGKACLWLLNNISKLNWSTQKYGNFIGNSNKYQVILNHMSFSINEIKYEYIGSISESKILCLIEKQLDNQNNLIKRTQKLENL